jgi:[ribosomal protein S18]-alanine N-acetyltransferase
VSMPVTRYLTAAMTEDDLPAVMEIDRQSFAQPWSESTYRTELRNRRDCRYVTARRVSAAGSQIVGYGGLWLVVDDGHITTLAVAPDQRGRGIGGLLLEALIDAALSIGAAQLTLEVRAGNRAAQRLYLSYGFAPVATRARYYQDNGEDALIMWTDDIRTDTYQQRLMQLRARTAERLAADQPPQSGASSE